MFRDVTTIFLNLRHRTDMCTYRCDLLIVVNAVVTVIVVVATVEVDALLPVIVAVVTVEVVELVVPGPLDVVTLFGYDDGREQWKKIFLGLKRGSGITMNTNFAYVYDTWCPISSSI